MRENRERDIRKILNHERQGCNGWRTTQERLSTIDVKFKCYDVFLNFVVFDYQFFNALRGSTPLTPANLNKPIV